MRNLVSALRSWTVAGLLIPALIGPAAAHAQQLPGAVQPGPILRAERAPPAARAEPSDRQRQGFKPIPPPQPGEVTFVLQGIELAGATPNAPPRLFEEFTSLLRKPVALSQLQVVAENVAVRYCTSCGARGTTQSGSRENYRGLVCGAFQPLHIHRERAFSDRHVPTRTLPSKRRNLRAAAGRCCTDSSRKQTRHCPQYRRRRRHAEEN
jgi:hypothetical protein